MSETSLRYGATATSSTFLPPLGRENITSERTRAFPFRPTPEPESLTDFVEETGTNDILIEALQKLYAVPNKPENPIEWLRLYFKYKAPDSTQEMEEMEMMLKSELTELQAELINSLELEAQNQAIIQRLELEVKNIKMSHVKNQQHEDFRKYKHHPENYHYRIRPDPCYQASKADLLLDEEDTVKRQDSFVEIVPFEADSYFMDQDQDVQTKKSEVVGIYDDYPALYFPEYMAVPETAIEEEDTVESEEASEGIAETEYDAGSEGGESDESRNSRILAVPAPPQVSKKTLEEKSKKPEEKPKKAEEKSKKEKREKKEVA